MSSRRDAFRSRKKDHLRLAQKPEVQSTESIGLIERFPLRHEAIPDADLKSVMLTTAGIRFSKTVKPFYISGMTAGHKDAISLNLRFAKACNQKNWIFGVGSQRREFEDSKHKATKDWALLRSKFPNLELIGNLGAIELRNQLKLGAKGRRRLNEVFSSEIFSAMAIHLNPLQEIIQPEGSSDWSGVKQAIEEWIELSPVPVILKETGCGIDSKTVKSFLRAGPWAWDVSGRSGTHWGRVEGFRAKEAGRSDLEALSKVFWNWGLSTADSLQMVESCTKAEVWASGGVKDGLEAVIYAALGASRVGFAGVALKAAQVGEKGLLRWMTEVEESARAAVFLTGLKNWSEVRESRPLRTKIV